jgi:hypothetical protein
MIGPFNFPSKNKIQNKIKIQQIKFKNTRQKMPKGKIFTDDDI